MSPVLVMLASACPKCKIEALPLKYGQHEFVGRVDGEVRIRVRKSNEKAAGTAFIDAYHKAAGQGPSQERPHVNARALCMYRMRREFGLSYPDIGRFFHRHHTSVMAAVRKHEPRWTADQVIQIPDLSGEWAI